MFMRKSRGRGAIASKRGGDAPPASTLERLASQVSEFMPFRAETRTSGVRLSDDRLVLKGAVDAIAAMVRTP